MQDHKEKKRRSAGDVPRFVQVLLFVTPLAYLVAGYGFPAYSSSGSAIRPASGSVISPKASGFSPQAGGAVDLVPVPKVPRSIIKFFDGNTVITCVAG